MTHYFTSFAFVDHSSKRKVLLGYSCCCVAAILILPQSHMNAYAETLAANKKAVRQQDISRQAACSPSALLLQGEKFNVRCEYAYSQNQDSVDRAQARDPNDSIELLEAGWKPALPGDSSENISANDRTLVRSQNYNYRGNIESRKFHKLNCLFATVMAKSRRVAFQSQQQAIEAGMSPCNWCLPPYWTSVRGKILLEKNLPWGLVP